MHDREDRDQPLIGIPAIVKDIRKSPEHKTANVWLFDNSATRWSGNNARDSRLDIRNKPLCHSGRSRTQVIIRSVGVFEQRIWMKRVGSHQLAMRADATRRRTSSNACSPGMSLTSPDSTSAMRRRTSSICARSISGGMLSISLSTMQSARSARSGGESRSISARIWATA
jgi:hypothetical protein